MPVFDTNEISRHFCGCVKLTQGDFDKKTRYDHSSLTLREEGGLIYLDTMDLTFMLLLLFLVASTWAEKLSFKTPQQTNEEKHSIVMPSNLNCDACLAVQYQLEKSLFFALQKYKKLDDIHLYETLENTCAVQHFNDYGIKPVNNINRLSGNGLAASDIPGMLSGGGKWPGRLVDKCYQVIGEIGEENIYKSYQATNDGTVSEPFQFAQTICLRGDGIQDCKTLEELETLIAKPKPKPSKDKKTKKKKKKKKKRKRKKNKEMDSEL